MTKRNLSLAKERLGALTADELASFAGGSTPTYGGVCALTDAIAQPDPFHTYTC